MDTNGARGHSDGRRPGRDAAGRRRAHAAWSVVAASAVVTAAGLAACASPQDGVATGERLDPAPAGASASAPATAAGSKAPAGGAPDGDPPGGSGGAKGRVSERYRDDALWLCRPAMPTDRCVSADLDATTVRADGSSSPAPWSGSTGHPVDCFYLYPTVNFALDAPNKTDLTSVDAEIASTVGQAARFSEVCNVYAPLYRQMHLPMYVAPPDDKAKAEAVAYEDVVEAFDHYLASDNGGRPVILIGDSQGSGHLRHLLQDRFDGGATAPATLVSAVLLGGDVTVPVGAEVGGSFRTIPLCTSVGQVGCVISFNSFSSSAPPDASTIMGLGTPGLEAACTNPAALGGGSGRIHPIVPVASGIVGAAAATPYVALPDALTATCTRAGANNYLQIAPVPVPPAGDGRDLTALLTSTPVFGLHAVEVDLTMGDLIDAVRRQVEATTPPVRSP